MATGQLYTVTGTVAPADIGDPVYFYYDNSGVYTLLGTTDSTTVATGLATSTSCWLVQ